MKQINALKLSFLAAFVALLGVGCASSGHARYDADSNYLDRGVGVSAGAEVGTDDDLDIDADADLDVDRNRGVDRDRDVDLDRNFESRTRMDGSGAGTAQSTVSALSFNPDTRAEWLNKFPFYDRNLRVIETHTFAVPDPALEMSATRRDLPEFSVNLPPGSVFVEAAGGAGEVRAGRVIQHSPNPVR
jgi:hypothetical protein